jgi:all-trans-retinol 13,14-reductase
MYFTPAEKEQGDYASKMIINCIMNFNQVRQWENTTVGHRGDDYTEWKQQHIDKVLHRMSLIYPNFKACIFDVFASSPLTIRDYYNVKDGSLYGFRKDCQNMALSQVPVYTKVRNLFLTGQNINLHGICGVPLTAINTAEAILGENVLIDKINADHE